MTVITSGLPGVRRVEQIMGLPVVVDVRDEEEAGAALDKLFDWLRWVDATFSTFKEDSDISRINRGRLRREDAQPQVRQVLEHCELLRHETDGYFDMHTPNGSIDPSGLVKGWSVDRAAAILDDAGLRNYAVNAGGDMRVLGRAVPELAWSVGIQHPLNRQQVAAVIEATDLAIATSGAYSRGDHVWNPHSARPPAGILSVTVVGPELATADAYATAAFAMGPDRAPQWTARLQSYEAMTILADETVFKTGGFPDE
ncbi:MAG: FAD:protein FMN transferase [Actinobacteria bacterium]|nr:MAG: FAD:protein FMN transferase [Actinomycetota bacterium]